MKPDCRKCKHFYVTFDQNFPRGCRAYGIKSSSLPSREVKNANHGAECLGFELKRSEKEKKKDLNDPKYWRA